MMLWFFIGFFVFALSFVGIFFAIVVMMNNRRKMAEEEEKYVRAEVHKTDQNARSMSLLEGRNYDHTQYFVEFYTEGGERLTLTCNKRTYHNLLPGFYGDLVYKGTKLLSFHRLEEHELRKQEDINQNGYFFQKRYPVPTGIQFYCDAPSIGVKIPTNDPIEVDVDEVKKYLSRLLENKTENFFGLDNGNMVIQFWHDGNTEQIGIDIPVPEKNGSYQALIQGIDKCIEIVEAYFDGYSVYELANFELIEF
jgi:hypothetical protein